MAAQRSVDIAVVGNGVRGLSIAVEIVRRAPETKIDEWPAWLDRLCDDVADDAAAPRTSRTGGTFVLLSGRSGNIAEDNFQAMRTALIKYNEPHEQADPQDIEELRV
ncbi:hypothetical protein ACWD4G_44270 [Streptomyces sp. NPDC002643]